MIFDLRIVSRETIISDTFLGVGFHLGAPCSIPDIIGSTDTSSGSEIISFTSGFLTSSSPVTDFLIQTGI